MDPLRFRRNLGTAIRLHREAAGHTQESLAAAIRICPGWIGSLERARGKPSLDTLLVLAGGLNMTVSDLFRAAEGDGPPDDRGRELLVWLSRLPPEAVPLVTDFVAGLCRILSPPAQGRTA